MEVGPMSNVPQIAGDFDEEGVELARHVAEMELAASETSLHTCNSGTQTVIVTRVFFRI